MRANRVLDRKEGRDLIMSEDHLASRIDDEANIEEPVFQIGMARLSLGDDEGLILARQLAQLLGLLAWDIDGAFTRELHMIEVEHLIVESLQRPFGQGDESDGEIQAR